jgi:hypothetical protein
VILTPAGGTNAGGSRKRRRGSRGGRGRGRARPEGDAGPEGDADADAEGDIGPEGDADADLGGAVGPVTRSGGAPELPDPPREGKVRSSAAADRALVPRVKAAPKDAGATAEHVDSG